MSRRSFISAAALGGTFLASTGLIGCTPSAGSSSSTQGSSSSAQSQEKTESAQSQEKAGTTASNRPWENPPPLITDATDGGSFDVVVVGAGIAGVATAEGASTNGSSVLVVEQFSKITAHGMDNGHIGSKWQQENGYNINPDEATKLVYRWSQQTANYNLIRQWAYRSGKVFDYFQELAAKSDIKVVKALSPTSKWGWDQLDEYWRLFPCAVSFVKEGDGMITPEGEFVNYRIVNLLYENAVVHGAEFMFNTRAEQLVQDSSGRVTGIIVTDEDGKHIKYNATKGVVLASGGIDGNEEMLKAWAPICLRVNVKGYFPENGNKGDGITMGLWAGAALSRTTAAPMVHLSNPDAVLSARLMCWLAVNRNGNRYGAEMCMEPYITNARLTQPGNISWSIYDSNYATYVEKQYPTQYEDILNPLDSFLSGKPVPIQEKIDARVDAGYIKKANTIEELANILGIPTDNFKNAVQRYNKWYDMGKDDDFGVPHRFLSKIDTPPFYAEPVPTNMLVCIHGLHVNDDSQVCDDDDNPIPGLFAVGNMQGDFFANSYSVHCPGISHGRALTFGNLVGEALAKDTVITKTM